MQRECRSGSAGTVWAGLLLPQHPLRAGNLSARRRTGLFSVRPSYRASESARDSPAPLLNDKKILPFIEKLNLPLYLCNQKTCDLDFDSHKAMCHAVQAGYGAYVRVKKTERNY